MPVCALAAQHTRDRELELRARTAHFDAVLRENCKKLRSNSPRCSVLASAGSTLRPPSSGLTHPDQRPANIQTGVEGDTHQLPLWLWHEYPEGVPSYIESRAVALRRRRREERQCVRRGHHHEECTRDRLVRHALKVSIVWSRARSPCLSALSALPSFTLARSSIGARSICPPGRIATIRNGPTRTPSAGPCSRSWPAATSSPTGHPSCSCPPTRPSSSRCCHLRRGGR